MKKKLHLFIVVCFLLSAHAFAQQKTITGKVTSSDDGSTIPGASIKIKGTTNAVQTNVIGTYSIKANSGDVLVFSYVGMVTQERTVGTDAVINIVLKSDASSLDEVIVTAYGIDRSKESLGYSAPTIKGDEVTATGRENFLNGLAGRVAGLSVNPTSGDPGASSQIILRGIVSISGDNTPLMVVDGIPIDNSVMSQTNTASLTGNNRSQDYTNRAADINPADIESYTILKGPEATALYGNLGASGAIVITTKKAKAGKASVSYNGSLRVESVNNAPEVQTVYSQGDANGVFNGGSTNYFGPKYPEGQKIYDNVASFFETGTAQKNNLVLEGGKESFTYRWSNEFVNNKGTIPTTQYKRFVTSLVGTAAVSNAVKVTTRFSYTNAYNKKANKGGSGYLMGLLRFPSRYDVNNWIDPLGNRLLTTGTIYSEVDNPFWDVNKNVSDDRTNSLLGNSTINIKPTKWLNINAILGTNISHTDGMYVYHTQSYSGSGTAAVPRGGVVNTYQKLNRRFDGSLTASATHKFGQFNNTYIIGGNFSDVNNNQNSARGQNMFDPDFNSINNTLPSTQSARLYIERYRNAGVFAQAILGYKSLMYLTLSGRVDAASRLLPNDPYFAYPSVSYAFNYTKLNALKDLSWLSNGKLRASYGITGKEPFKVYSLGTRLVTTTSTGGGFTYDLANGGNPDLVPEQTRNFETGLEASFFKDRIGIDFTFYKLNSHKQIITPRISYGTGSVVRIMNGGDVENKGVEFQLRGSPLRSENLNWDMIFNFTHNKSKVNAIADDLPEYYESDSWIGDGIRSAVYPGSSTGAIGGWKNLRNNNGDLLINPATGLPSLASDQDFYLIGDRMPKFTLGFSNSLNYKTLTLSFLFDLRVGGDVYNQTQYELYRRGLSIKTLDRDVPRVITGVLRDGLENTANPTRNTIAVTPAVNSNYYSSTTAGIAPEMFVEHNIKSLRLRDITVAYDFPARLTSKTKFISGFGLYVTLTDVFLITNYSGMDPDVNGNNPSVGGYGGYGIDFGNMGRPLGVNMGLRIKL
ncbi:SusC/RagA family TonB-linked outer membrane protein [Pedobacter metabolipauper]|uniref:TonB-linked SusC/RagA family outer membrane protein n=1 Tax=Pedobacter metabolipauper TaxID=425513 RepID=A0A4R6SWI0_9SPHI|nr:SusC/RagA family TonB-linked outer membrane protein [Pedobacter metabolipauper]TDQ09746.1 TonB-linked SusC/RagA family outer membrane protein [Pedobacter metabolipauper]